MLTIPVLRFHPVEIEEARKLRVKMLAAAMNTDAHRNGEPASVAVLEAVPVVVMDVHGVDGTTEDLFDDIAFELYMEQVKLYAPGFKRGGGDGGIGGAAAYADMVQ